VYGCGSNEDGQLGTDEERLEDKFVVIPNLKGVKYFGTGHYSYSSFAAIE
jgi:hypothetical protein